MSLVQLTTPLPHIAQLTFMRPEVMNALNTQTRQEIAVHFAALAKDNDIRCVIITGGPDVFVAGADLNEFVDKTAADMAKSPNPKLWEAVAGFEKPIIAAVNGYALGGGCELAMHCDIIVAGKGAKFGQTELKVGIMPGAGGTQRLTHAVGKYKAMKAILTAEILSADEAFEMGLVSEVVGDDEVLPRALKLAKKITLMPPLAVQAAKASILAAQELPLSQGMDFEQKQFRALFDTDDKTEGMTAFLEKRRAQFKGA